jgi:hypothetical protein
MDGYEYKRRDFLKKLGLIASATVLTASGAVKLTEIIEDKVEDIVLTKEQSAFLDKYEKWLEAFHDMAKFQKKDPDHLENNKKLMALSEEAKAWQKDLIEHMKDENFARYFMIRTEKITDTINS